MREFDFSETNECVEGTNNCDTNADCQNIDGSFTCTCQTGYSGDGVTCTGRFLCCSGIIHISLSIWKYKSYYFCNFILSAPAIPNTKDEILGKVIINVF